MMSFATLALVVGAGLVGPLLTLVRPGRIPVVFGQLVAGIALGATGLGLLDASNPSFTFLADIGFALVMFVVGTHVPISDPHLRKGLWTGAANAALVGLVAAVLGWAIAAAFGTAHAGIYAVLIASSSAALVLPIVQSLGLGGRVQIVKALPQVAIADAVCIVALPLVMDPSRAGRAALGALAVGACSLLLFFLLKKGDTSGLRQRIHDWSEENKFAVELRINLAILCGLAALATTTGVSIMLAGFCFGLVVAAIGEPRRLARQLFALTEGFFGPIFFVWLGASLNLRDLGAHPKFILLGVVLGAGAVAAHLMPRLLGQRPAIGVLSAAQLGVPMAAVTIGSQLNLLEPGEAPALILGALISIVAASAAGGRLAAGQRPKMAE